MSFLLKILLVYSSFLILILILIAAAGGVRHFPAAEVICFHFLMTIWA